MVLTSMLYQAVYAYRNPIRHNVAVCDGTLPLFWSIDPALPSGLAFDKTNGSITGSVNGLPTRILIQTLVLTWSMVVPERRSPSLHVLLPPYRPPGTACLVLRWRTVLPGKTYTIVASNPAGECSTTIVLEVYSPPRPLRNARY